MDKTSDRTHSVWYAEAWAGSGANAAHLNIAVGLKGSPIEQAFLSAMSSPQPGNIPFLTVLQPNWPIKPFTLFVNKADLRSELHSRLTWGPAQAGIAEGILGAVQRGIIPPAQVDNYLIIASVWVDWNANSDEEVYQNNRDAALRAIERAFNGEPAIEDLLARLGHAENPFLKH
ncbi:aldehyde-activating protein [Ktedonobacteria bacterium brp13]|nr:aldehyde-activating protein [Ktedonobacteria bacterium brp13]